jgi:hypothetical protein
MTGNDDEIVALVRRDGRWWIADSQNTAVIPGPP